MRNKGHHVTFDSNENTFTIHKRDGTKHALQQSSRGFYFMDTTNNVQESAFLINTVENKRLNYSNRDYSQAVLAQNLQQTIGHPSLKSFLKIIDNNLLKNCSITRRDIMIAKDIFGPDVGDLKGKTVRNSPAPVKVPVTSIPEPIMSHYRNVVLASDIMFVNKVAFLVTISRHLYFGTTEAIANQQLKTVAQSIKQEYKLYLQRGFRITHLLMDGQFEHIQGHLVDVQVIVNIFLRDEHVPEVERFIRTLKERTRAYTMHYHSSKCLHE